MIVSAFFFVWFGCSAKTSPSSLQPEAPPGVMAPATASAPSPSADPREVRLSKAIALLLEKRHLLGKPIDDATSKLAFSTYITRLDSNKLFLLASDHDKLGRYADKIDDELRSGNLELAHEGQSSSSNGSGSSIQRSRRCSPLR